MGFDTKYVFNNKIIRSKHNEEKKYWVQTKCGFEINEELKKNKAIKKKNHGLWIKCVFEIMGFDTVFGFGILNYNRQ